MNNRKYIGVPTQKEIYQQYNEVIDMTRGIRSLEEIKCFAKEHPEFDIEINCENIDQYEKDDDGNFKLIIKTVLGKHIQNINDEGIEMIRYEYKNILVYYCIENGEGKYSDTITVYSDDGEQLVDGKYFNYEKEIRDVASRRVLDLME